MTAKQKQYKTYMPRAHFNAVLHFYYYKTFLRPTFAHFIVTKSFVGQMIINTLIFSVDIWHMYVCMYSISECSNKDMARVKRSRHLYIVLSEIVHDMSLNQ